MKKIIITIVVIIIAGAGVYFFMQRSSDNVDISEEKEVEIDTTQVESDEQVNNEVQDESKTVIGTSVLGSDIIAYHYGNGDTELLFVGGIHGAYAYNTVLVAEELMNHLEKNPIIIPENVMVTVIPVLNPDGVKKVPGIEESFAPESAPLSPETTIPGRFNANDVDLNRNFDCEWQSEGTWQNRTVSGGDKPFSEPESQVLRDYVEAHTLTAAVVWYSAAGGVFASNCKNGVSSETLAITNLYADASGYKAYETFDFYKVTGDMVNWLAKGNIPAISVLLTTHNDVEWEKNRKAVEALLEHYAR